MSIGVPIKVLHEAEGHIVTCETIDGEVYRGKLIEAEDNMNCQVMLKRYTVIMNFYCYTENNFYIDNYSGFACYGYIQRWTCCSNGERVCKRIKSAFYYTTRYAAECSYV